MMSSMNSSFQVSWDTHSIPPDHKVETSQEEMDGQQDNKDGLLGT